MRIRGAAVVAGAVALALVVGIALGWALFGRDDDPATHACALAEDLPASVEKDVPVDELMLVGAVGRLAEAAGTGADMNDLDTVGTAGRNLADVLNTLRFEDYPEALDELRAACDDR